MEAVPPSLRPSVRDWASDRAGFSSMRELMAARKVDGSNPLLYVGGLLVFLLVLQIASGILLMLHYQPTANDAHQSVAFVIGGVPYGDLVRNLHLWTGDLLIAGVFVQLFSVAIRRTFRAPRELLWVSGLVAFFVVLAMAFTGVVLPWSQSAYLQARVGSEIVGQIPWIGAPLRYVMRGGEEVTTATLRRAYGFHVAVLPATLTLLLGFHAMALRSLTKHRLTVELPVHRALPVYPDFLVRLAAAMAGLLAVVISLATFVDRPLGAAASIGSSPLSARPPWYLLSVHDLLVHAPRELLGMSSAKFIVGAGALVILLAFFVPFFDRKGSRVTAVIAALLLVLAVSLSIHALV